MRYLRKLNMKYKHKVIVITNKRVADLVGSNIKLKKRGWRLSNYNVINEL